jgi:hypothetical protein
LGISPPNPNEIAFSRSCNETSGISPSTYRTFLWRGADQRSSDAPPATANPMERLNHDLPTPRGAYSIARLLSGRIGPNNISLAGISRFIKSLNPTACSGGRSAARIGIVPRAGKSRLRTLLIENMFSAATMLTGFVRIPCLYCGKLPFWLGLNAINRLPL